MPVFPPFFAELVEVRLQQTLPGGVDAVSVPFVVRSGVGTFAAETAEIVTAFTTFYETLDVSLHPDWALNEIQTIDRSLANGQTLDYPITGVVGEETANALPTQTQMVMTLRTSNSGRRYRGRMFLAGWTEASNDDDGGINSAARATVAAAGQQLIDDLTADGHVLVVLSRGNTSPPAPVAWSAFYTPVTSVRVDPEWDVLRSRRA